MRMMISLLFCLSLVGCARYYTETVGADGSYTITRGFNTIFVDFEQDALSSTQVWEADGSGSMDSAGAGTSAMTSEQFAAMVSLIGVVR